MPNENEILNQETTDTAEDYISVINDMKKNTVSKDQYQKLREENQRLLKSLVDNEEIKVEKEVEKVDVDAIRQKIFNEDASLSDIDYVENVLKLRNALIADGKEDPFLPVGKRISPTDEDIAVANKVADGLAYCLEYAEGDNQVFINELQRITVDSYPSYRKR